jgi:tRNA pseudouridine synthase 10
VSTAGHAYRLCGYCVQRQDGAGPLEVVETNECFVCEGLMNNVSEIVKAAARKVRSYQFGTFTAGVSLPEGVQEREDELRSDLRLKGNETIKTQVAKLIAARVSTELRKRIDRLRPDLTLLINLGTGEVTASSKSVFFYGRYTKPRGTSQKREICPDCGGAGCSRCGRSGFERKPSVENLIRSRLFSFSGSDKMTFTWLGSEDRESRVFLPGRPFIAEVKNPMKRTFPKKFTARYRGGQVSVSAGKILPAKPVRLPTFKFRTEILATAATKVPAEALLGLHSAFKMREVRFERPHDKPALKIVYRADAMMRGRTLVIRAELDGGLPVKRFVSGELVSPSVSEVLKTEVRCRRFDICGVTETGKFEIGEVARV